MATQSPANEAPQPAPRFSWGWLSLDRFSVDRLSPDSWAVAAAVIFVLLVVAGVFPRVSW